MMKKTLIPLLAALAAYTAFVETAAAERLTLDCRGRKDPLDPYGRLRNIVTLDFEARKAHFSGSRTGTSDITEITDTKIMMGRRWIDRTNGEYFHGLGFMDCRVAETQGF